LSPRLEPPSNIAHTHTSTMSERWEKAGETASKYMRSGDQQIIEWIKIGPIQNNSVARRDAERFLVQNNMAKEWWFTGQWTNPGGQCEFRRIWRGGNFCPRGVDVIFSYDSRDLHKVERACIALEESGISVHFENLVAVGDCETRQFRTPQWKTEWGSECLACKVGIIVNTRNYMSHPTDAKDWEANMIINKSDCRPLEWDGKDIGELLGMLR